jgi:hypothetical protein
MPLIPGLKAHLAQLTTGIGQILSNLIASIAEVDKPMLSQPSDSPSGQAGWGLGVDSVGV